MKTTTAEDIRKALKAAMQDEALSSTTIAVLEALRDRAECIAKLLKKVP